MFVLLVGLTQTLNQCLGFFSPGETFLVGTSKCLKSKWQKNVYGFVQKIILLRCLLVDISQDALLRLSLYNFPAFYIIWPWGSGAKGKASTFPQYLAAVGQWSPLFALEKFLMLSLVNLAGNNWLTWFVAIGADEAVFCTGKVPFVTPDNIAFNMIL